MPAPRKLSIETIVAAAIDLLRERGLDAVTQRAVAQRLGVEAASLYRHVPGKDRLLAQITLALFRDQIDRVGRPATWQDWLTRFGATLWQTQQEIPDCARLVLTTRFAGDDYAAMMAWASEPLTSYAIDPAVAHEMTIALQAIVLGLAGLVFGPNAQLVQNLIPAERLLDDAISAFVSGWEIRLQK